MIQRRNRLTPTSLLAVAGLCLLLSAPSTLATAVPAEAVAPGSPLTWLADWWSDLAGEWRALTAGSEVAPDADPNGSSTAPQPDGDLSTAQTPEGDGEAAPNADPDG